LNNFLAENVLLFLNNQLRDRHGNVILTEWRQWNNGILRFSQNRDSANQHQFFFQGLGENTITFQPTVKNTTPSL